MPKKRRHLTANLGSELKIPTTYKRVLDIDDRGWSMRFAKIAFYFVSTVLIYGMRPDPLTPLTPKSPGNLAPSLLNGSKATADTLAPI